MPLTTGAITVGMNGHTVTETVLNINPHTRCVSDCYALLLRTLKLCLVQKLSVLGHLIHKDHKTISIPTALHNWNLGWLAWTPDKKFNACLNATETEKSVLTFHHETNSAQKTPVIYQTLFNSHVRYCTMNNATDYQLWYEVVNQCWASAEIRLGSSLWS